MAGRRRQKNPLLMRIFVISVLLHVIALPILAYYGAFKKIQAAMNGPQVIVVPPPPKEKEQAAVKKQQKVAQHNQAKGKSAAKAHSAAKSNLNQPKVVAAKGPETSGGGEPTVDSNGAGKAGIVPTVKSGGTGQGANTNPKPDTKSAPTPTTPTPKPDPKPQPEPKAETKVAAKLKEPVFTSVEATYSPQPAIPDDLRNDVLTASMIAEFAVQSDGTPGEIKVVKSTGNKELDDIALETARKWRFKPATRDGQATEGRVRLHIDFEVR